MNQTTYQTQLIKQNSKGISKCLLRFIYEIEHCQKYVHENEKKNGINWLHDFDHVQFFGGYLYNTKDEIVTIFSKYNEVS